MVKFKNLSEIVKTTLIFYLISINHYELKWNLELSRNLIFRLYPNALAFQRFIEYQVYLRFAKIYLI